LLVYIHRICDGLYDRSVHDLATIDFEANVIEGDNSGKTLMNSPHLQSRHVHLVVLFGASAKLIDLDDEVIDVIFFDNYRWNEHLFI